MSIAELRNLPRSEKLRIVELLWSDLAEESETFESPAWHKQELQKTESEFAVGRIEILEWADAKKELRARLK